MRQLPNEHHSDKGFASACAQVDDRVLVETCVQEFELVRTRLDGTFLPTIFVLALSLRPGAI